MRPIWYRRWQWLTVCFGLPIGACAVQRAADAPTQKVYDCGAAYAACASGSATADEYRACRAAADARCLDAGAP